MENVLSDDNETCYDISTCLRLFEAQQNFFVAQQLEELMLFSDGWWHGNDCLGSSNSLNTLKLVDEFAQVVHLSKFSVDYNVKLPCNCVSHLYALDFECCVSDFPRFARFGVN